MRELIPDLDRVTEEMIEAIQCGVRYRLRQLQLLFGDALQEPDARFELEIALRARRLLGPAGQDEGLGILPRRDDARR